MKSLSIEICTHDSQKYEVVLRATHSPDIFDKTEEKGMKEYTHSLSLWDIAPISKYLPSQGAMFVQRASSAFEEKTAFLYQMSQTLCFVANVLFPYDKEKYQIDGDPLMNADAVVEEFLTTMRDAEYIAKLGKK